jgi:hypothetical protein
MAAQARQTGVHLVKIGLRSAGLAVAFACLGAGPVAADCQPVDSVQAALESAEVAFVGTAVAVSEARSSATFRVEETWVGTVGPQVEVFGLNGGRGVSEDDRTWQAGLRYLVIPYVIGGQLADHLCSGTTRWTNELVELRPPGTVAAAAAEAPAPPPWPVLLAVASVLVVAIAGWLAFRQTDSGTA